MQTTPQPPQKGTKPDDPKTAKTVFKDWASL